MELKPLFSLHGNSGFPRLNVWEGTAMVTWLSFYTLLNKMSATRSAAICPAMRVCNELGEIHKQAVYRACVLDSKHIMFGLASLGSVSTEI